MDWRGEQALGRMLEERVKRHKGRGRRLDSQRSWYEEGFRDGWELAVREIEQQRRKDAKTESE